MDRPRLLLCPQFTEVEWAIASQLAEWAEVATFDAPGVGDEPISGDPGRFDRENVVRRGLQELDDRGWESYFVAGDGWGTPTAVGVAVARPDRVLGVALGHAALHLEREGERPALNAEVVAAMTQLMRSDYDSFVQYGITQFTLGGFDHDQAARMVDRFPDMDVASGVWDMLLEQHEEIGGPLASLDVPLLLCKHEGCLVFTPEGFEDMAAAFPDARTVGVDRAPPASDDFAAAMREFCESVVAERA
jgi:pimeloyl-ACP methyl ester carboxylesterase